jgi:archaellum biogenesis protein FlaJ (TadC family)
MISIGAFVIQIVSLFHWRATVLNWRPLTTIGEVPQRALKHSINIVTHQFVFILFIFVLDYD